MVMKIVRKQITTSEYAIYNGDSCRVLPTLPDESVGLSVFSPPFASLYSYSDDDADLGNSKTYEEFFEHYNFIVRELYRLMLPGRIVAVHCMDLPTFKSSGEEIGLRDFSGDLIRCHQKSGFIFHSRHCIWKDPLVAATRTKALGLAHKQIVKDSAMCRTGIPDYLLAFRKPGENPKPISHERGLCKYPGSRSIPTGLERFRGHDEQGTNKLSHWIWQQIASPVWMDIRQTHVLPYRPARDADDERHICPLQLDTIERCIMLWSTPGDIVLTPFMGVGSEVFVAVKNKRKAIGIELKSRYFRQAARNLKSLQNKQARRTLPEVEDDSDD